LVKWIEYRLLKHGSNGLNTGYLNMGQMDWTQFIKTWVKWIEHRLFKHGSNGL